MKYVYPVILTPDSGGYLVNFPDIESCYTEGDDLAEALEMAKDVLALRLCDYENENRPIPVATSQTVLPLEIGQLVSLVSADTIEYRKFWDNKAVKKTLTLPRWLNTWAEKEEINFSAALQRALKEELKIAQ